LFGSCVLPFGSCGDSITEKRFEKRRSTPPLNNPKEREADDCDSVTVALPEHQSHSTTAKRLKKRPSASRRAKNPESPSQTAEGDDWGFLGLLDLRGFWLGGGRGLLGVFNCFLVVFVQDSQYVARSPGGCSSCGSSCWRKAPELAARGLWEGRAAASGQCAACRTAACTAAASDDATAAPLLPPLHLKSAAHASTVRVRSCHLQWFSPS
jgi:hypothetical protein